MNCSHWVPLAFLVASLACAADDLPKHAPGETPLDFEPKLMLNDVPNSPLQGPEPAAPSSGVDVSRLENQVEKAKKTAVWRERLFRMGVLAKVQAEQSALTVVRLTKDLEEARRDVAKAAVEAITKRLESKEATQEGLDKAQAELAAAETVAADASKRWEQAQFDAAQINLKRQRQLYAVGATTKSQLRRAEERVASMKSGSQ